MQKQHTLFLNLFTGKKRSVPFFADSTQICGNQPEVLYVQSLYVVCGRVIFFLTRERERMNEGFSRQLLRLLVFAFRECTFRYPKPNNY